MQSDKTTWDATISADRGGDGSLGFALYGIHQKGVADVNNSQIDPVSRCAAALRIHYHNVTIEGQQVALGETLDFSRADPWSKLVIESVKNMYEEGIFKGDTTILEAGVGDGRNLLQVSHFTYQETTVSKISQENKTMFW